MHLRQKKEHFNEDVYEAYPYSYPTAEQVKQHEEAIAMSKEARNTARYEPYPYSFPTAEMVKEHNEAMKKYKEERAAKEAKEAEIRHHAWE